MLTRSSQQLNAVPHQTISSELKTKLYNGKSNKEICR